MKSDLEKKEIMVDPRQVYLVQSQSNKDKLQFWISLKCFSNSCTVLCYEPFVSETKSLFIVRAEANSKYILV